MGNLAAHVAALALYPGLAALSLFGVAVEGALARGLGWVAPVRLRSLGGRQAAAAGATAAFAVLAAAEVPVPMSPVPPSEASMLVAGMALVAASWTGWAALPERGAGPLLAAQLAWLVALLTPAAVPLDLHPTTVGGLAVPGFLPLKVLAAALYLLAMPALVHALGGRGRGRGRAAWRPSRVFLWLPAGALFAAVFAPLPPAGPSGLALFLALAAAACGVALGLAGGLTRAGEEFRWVAYPRLLAGLAAATLAAGIVTAALLGG